MFVFKAAVVGAGAMGAEIAHTIASADIPVVLKDIDQDHVEQGLTQARALWQAQIEAGKLEPAELQRKLALITGTTGYENFGDVDFVIEAVPELMELKQTVFAELDELTPGHAILATSTSALSVTEIGEGTSRPEKVLGFHFPSPASATRLVEIVEGEDTSLEAAQTAINFAQAIRKTPIRCAEAPGFVVNRILGAAGPATDERADRFALGALVEGCLILEEGVAALKDIDLGLMAGAGITPPPFQRADQLGVDTMLAHLERAQAEWGEQFEPPTILRRLVVQGRLGVKAGQGFYPYPRPDADWPDGPVKLETRGQVAIAWLDRPPANSISIEAVAALRSAWDAAVSRGVRAVVFASANPLLFCAGADIKAFTKMDTAAARELVQQMHGLLREMESSRLVTIAAVNALALGGGCELAMACDFRIAASSATFGQPEINLGIIPGFGGTQRLPRLIGPGRAMELNLTGEAIGAEEALALGLATRVVPDHELLDTALAWAAKLAGQAPLAVEQIKRLAGTGDLDAGIEAEQEAFASVFASEDAREGIAAFLQKRPARFRGA